MEIYFAKKQIATLKSKMLKAEDEYVQIKQIQRRQARESKAVQDAAVIRSKMQNALHLRTSRRTKRRQKAVLTEQSLRIKELAVKLALRFPDKNEIKSPDHFTRGLISNEDASPIMRPVEKTRSS